MKIAECSSKSADLNIYLERDVYLFQLYSHIQHCGTDLDVQVLHNDHH